MKNVKTKLAISIFMLMIIMTTLVSYKSYAREIPEEQLIVNSNFLLQAGNAVEISYNLLESNSNIFCTQKGTHIPSANNVQCAYVYNGNNRTAENKTNAELQAWTETVGVGVACSLHNKIFKSETYGKYTVEKDRVVCTPKVAFVLNYAQKNTGDYSSYVQNAWWQFRSSPNCGNVFSIVEDAKAQNLTNAATAYQKFVKKIAKNGDQIEDTSKYQERTHTFSNGTAKIGFPELDIESTFSINTSKVKVNYYEEDQTYIVGPFTMKYVEGAYDGPGEEFDEKFGFIDGFRVYTDASSEPLERGTDWKFLYTDSHTKGKVYPDSSKGSETDPFYIEMKYIPNATKITGIEVDYKYLIAGGEYQLLDGTYETQQWNHVTTEVQVANSDGQGTHTEVTHSFLKNGTKGTRESQKLAVMRQAARWYETKTLTLGTKQESTLIIEKKVLDENGNELKPIKDKNGNEVSVADQIKEKFGDYQYFDFEVKITYPGKKPITTYPTVRAGTSLKVGTYSWGDEGAPSYEVREITPGNSNWKYVSISSNAKGVLKNNETVTVTAINQMIPNKGYIEIDKKISGEADHSERFEFEAKARETGEVKNGTVIVPQGQLTGKAKIGPFSWYGKELNVDITEIETEDSKKYNSYINPPHVILKPGETAGSSVTLPVNVLNNKDGDKRGYISIKKETKDDNPTNDSYTFHVKVTGEGLKNEPLDFDETIKAGETKGPYEIVWEGETPPTFEITEKDNNEVKNVNIEVTGADNVNITGKTVTGTIKENADPESGAYVDVKFTNDVKGHKGKIKVIKEFFSNEKMTEEELKDLAKEHNIEFDVEVVIKGTFEYEGTKTINSTRVINRKLSASNNWQFEIDGIKWWGGETPTYTVREISKPGDKWGWECIGTNWSNAENESTSSEGHKLTVDGTDEVTIINTIPEKVVVDLTFKMAGLVWVDEPLEDKNTDSYRGQVNGVYDEGETLKENTEVTVYKIIYDKNGKQLSREVATAYKDIQGNPVNFPIITKTDGKWEVPRISVPGLTDEQLEKGYTADYDVEFVYDGQTYEPTEYLSYKVSSSAKDGYNKTVNDKYVKKNEGNAAERAKEFKAQKTKADRAEYERDSMAIEISNNTKKITKVSGKSEIDANGDTIGSVTYDGKEVDISYSSNDAGKGYPTHSTLNTVDSNGRILDIFKATATTSAGNLTFPFNYKEYDGSGLYESSKEFNKVEGFSKSYKFNAVYNYCLHINLGLKRKEEVDIGLTKNLDNAKVIVNEKMYQYNYSGYYDLTEEKQDSLRKDIRVDRAEQKIQYTLGLYRSDYYYRAEMYKKNTDRTVYDELANFYTSIGGDVQDTELDIFLTYKIKLQNTTSSYAVKIDSIDDYYDSSFELVTSNQEKYLKTKTEKVNEGDGVKTKEIPVNDKIVVANPSDYADKWKTVKERIVGSDKDANGNNILYNKMTADGLGIELAPGQSKEFYITFKVKKDKDETYGIEDSIKLGQKCNVAEIASYSTFEKETGENAGRIDRDSAPGNVNISAYNQKPWYEDDTFSAPRIQLKLIEQNAERTIEGVVWEDNSQNENIENSGYNQKIGNAVKNGDDEKPIDGLTTELVQKVSVKKTDGTYQEYDYIWPTNELLPCLNNYSMEKVIGLDTTLETKDGGKYSFNDVIAGDYVVRFGYGDTRPYSGDLTYPNYRIKSQNYSTAEFYNGQDYKSSKFNADLKNNQTIQADSYLDIDTINDYNNVRNTAIDSEARRLQVVENSREINNEKSTLMFNYDKALFENYNMWADTPRLDINIELSDKYYDGWNNTNYEYKVKNINFGLEERPITQLTLDKQIEEIIITTSDGNNIMDAKYKISYEDFEENGNFKAKVELDRENSYGIDNLQALNRDEATNLGFRYINVDSSILEGTTITVKYKFTVLNTGEVDRTGKLHTMLYENDTTQFETARDELNKQLTKFVRNSDGTLENQTKYGKYVGTIYYYGEDKKLFDYDDNGNPDEDYVVSSRVRQLVDYIDNDVEFRGDDNKTKNMSWSATTVEVLKPHIDDAIIDGERILDKDGISYTTDKRTNLAVSVDENDSSSEINNADFIVDLVPQNANGEGKYETCMWLTVSKYVSGDADDLQIDNIAEIIRYNNKVGRRDELTIAGNQNPAEIKNESDPLNPDLLNHNKTYERDTSATEVITLSPPFGSSILVWRLQVAASITAGLAIVAGGIVFIKKKLLK